jgi:hypothetical protein
MRFSVWNLLNLFQELKPVIPFSGQRSAERPSSSGKVLGPDAAPAAEPEQQRVHQVGGRRQLTGQQVKTRIMSQS